MTFPLSSVHHRAGLYRGHNICGKPHYHPFSRFHCLYDPAGENNHENSINTGGKHCSAPAEMEQSSIHSVCSDILMQQNPAPPRSCFSRRRNKMLITKEMLPTQNKSPARVLSLACPLKADLNKILKSLRKFILYLLYYTNIK